MENLFTYLNPNNVIIVCYNNDDNNILLRRVTRGLVYYFLTSSREAHLPSGVLIFIAGEMEVCVVVCTLHGIS